MTSRKARRRRRSLARHPVGCRAAVLQRASSSEGGGHAERLPASSGSSRASPSRAKARSRRAVTRSTGWSGRDGPRWSCRRTQMAGRPMSRRAASERRQHAMPRARAPAPRPAFTAELPGLPPEHQRVGLASCAGVRGNGSASATSCVARARAAAARRWTGNWSAKGTTATRPGRVDARPGSRGSRSASRRWSAANRWTAGSIAVAPAARTRRVERLAPPCAFHHSWGAAMRLRALALDHRRVERARPTTAHTRRSTPSGSAQQVLEADRDGRCGRARRAPPRAASGPPRSPGPRPPTAPRTGRCDSDSATSRGSRTTRIDDRVRPLAPDERQREQVAGRLLRPARLAVGRRARRRVSDSSSAATDGARPASARGPPPRSTPNDARARGVVLERQPEHEVGRGPGPRPRVEQAGAVGVLQLREEARLRSAVDAADGRPASRPAAWCPSAAPRPRRSGRRTGGAHGGRCARSIAAHPSAPAQGPVGPGVLRGTVSAPMQIANEAPASYRSSAHRPGRRGPSSRRPWREVMSRRRLIRYLVSRGHQEEGHRHPAGQPVVAAGPADRDGRLRVRDDA